MRGSSPLARGLRDKSVIRGSDEGIIPARAGFTTPRMLTWTCWWIIPARAGFTGCRHRFRGLCRDHPRSRGVYSTPRYDNDVSGGSSPLARGLLTHLPTVQRRVGIIPARAGFTYRMSGPQPSSRDHPRSRGVYRPFSAEISDFQGSSPLARGLPPTTGQAMSLARIIPARAGFTPRCRWPPRRAPDHPRSRGVYSPPSGTVFWGTGSSPLARGLREKIKGTVGAGRIIPARAGFTIAQKTVIDPSPDHPRSRGVYATPAGQHS